MTRVLPCLTAALLLVAATAVGAELRGHGGPVRAIAVAPGGAVITGSFDTRAIVWSLGDRDGPRGAAVPYGPGECGCGPSGGALRHWRGGWPDRGLGAGSGRTRAGSRGPQRTRRGAGRVAGRVDAGVGIVGYQRPAVAARGRGAAGAGGPRRQRQRRRLSRRRHAGQRRLRRQCSSSGARRRR